MKYRKFAYLTEKNIKVQQAKSKNHEKIQYITFSICSIYQYGT